MSKILRCLLGGAFLSIALLGITAVEPAVNADSQLVADEWQFYLSSTGEDYCDGCCAPQSFCCTIPLVCPPG